MCPRRRFAWIRGLTRYDRIRDSSSWCLYRDVTDEVAISFWTRLGTACTLAIPVRISHARSRYVYTSAELDRATQAP